MTHTKRNDVSVRLANQRIAKCLRLVCLVVISVGLSACSRTISFEEEVEISPGEVIVIERSEKHGRACEAFSCGWRFENSTVAISIKEVKDWKEELRPMLLQKNKDGTIALIARTVFGGCVRYREFVFRNSKWEEVPVEEKYFEMRINLLIADKDEFESRAKKISLSEKKKKNDQPGFPSFVKQILRNPPC